MLRCQDVSELATDYMERALPLRDRLAVRMHLTACSACRAYVSQLQQTAALLRNRNLGDTPADTAERIVGKLATRDSEPTQE